MNADVRAVPVQFVRKENGPRPVFRQDFDGRNDHFRPCGRVLRAGGGMHVVQSIGRQLREAEAKIAAGVLQFLETRGFAFRQPSQGDGGVDDIPSRLAQQAQGQPAAGGFIVGMRGEEERFGCVRRDFGPGGEGNPPKGRERPSSTSRAKPETRSV